MKASKLLLKVNAFNLVREIAVLSLEGRKHYGINEVYTDNGRRLNFPYGVVDATGKEIDRVTLLGDAMSIATVSAFETGLPMSVVTRFSDVVLMTVTRTTIVIPNNEPINLHNIGKS